jgi:hypothetical protein
MVRSRSEYYTSMSVSGLPTFFISVKNMNLLSSSRKYYFVVVQLTIEIYSLPVSTANGIKFSFTKMSDKQKVIFIQCSQRVLYVHTCRVLSIIRAWFLFYVKHVLQYVNGHAAPPHPYNGSFVRKIKEKNTSAELSWCWNVSHRCRTVLVPKCLAFSTNNLYV